MYNLSEVLDECESDLDKIGIKYGKVLDIHMNSRATNRWGQTRGTQRGGFVIEVSKTLMDERNPRESLKNTVMHELLHTCPGTNGHTGKWLEYANRVNQVYGYHVRKGDSLEDLGIVVDCVPRKIKYQFQCESCGSIITRQKASNFTKHPNQYRCSKCGGRFKEIKD